MSVRDEVCWRWLEAASLCDCRADWLGAVRLFQADLTAVIFRTQLFLAWSWSLFTQVEVDLFSDASVVPDNFSLRVTYDL